MNHAHLIEIEQQIWEKKLKFNKIMQKLFQ
jgi:hypothetical protein